MCSEIELHMSMMWSEIRGGKVMSDSDHVEVLTSQESPIQTQHVY